MKQINFLKKLANTPPMGFKGASRVLGLVLVLLTLGVGNAWGVDYMLTTSLTEGDYVIGAVKGSAGTDTHIYAFANTDNSSWAPGTETTPSGGKISNPASSIVWHLTPIGNNGFSLQNGTKYLTIGTGTSSGSVRYNSTSSGTIYFAATGSNSTYEISGVSSFTVGSGNQVGYNIGSGYRQYAQRTHSTGTTSGSISVQFRFYKKASAYTVTLKDDNSTLTEASPGAGVTLPSRTGCTGYTFVGWTASWTEEQDEWTQIAPAVIPAGSYSPSANVNLYPVYRKGTGAASATITTTLTAGKQYVFGAVKAAASTTLANNTAIGAIGFTGLYSSTSWGQYTTYTPNTSGVITASIGSAYIWTLESISSGKYSFKNNNNASYPYIYLNTSTGASQAGLNTTGQVYLEDVSATCKDAFKLHPGSSSTNKLLLNTGNNYGYRMYGSSQGESASMCPYIRFYEYNIDYYYISVPNCCSDPGLAYGTGEVVKTFGALAFTNTLTNNHGVTVTYSSSDPTVATVNGSGQVTILKAGSTTITASSIAQTVAAVSYCADEASYTLTVNKANITPTLTYESTTLTYGGSNSAAPTVGGNTGSGAVSYAVTTATPAGCVTVDPSTGVVTPVAAGSATITATIATTTNYNGKTATANFTVNKADISPTLSYASTSLTVGQTSAAPTISGNTGSGTVTYSSSDKEVATVAADGKVTAVAEGSATITATIGATANYNGNTASATFSIAAASACLQPTFSPAEGTYNAAQNVAISSTEGATIYYTTNGDEPTTSSSVYSSPIAVSANTTIKAYAVKSGMTDSEVGTAVYNIRCAQPSFTPAADTYNEIKSVTISCATEGATIYYTTDGSDPDDGSTEYTGAISVSSTQTIKAIAYKTGMTESEVNSAAYELKCATPTITAGGTFTDSKNVELSCATEGATIRYTTDNTEPTGSSTIYSTAIPVTSTTTIKAKAFKDGWTASDEASATYTIQYSVTWKVNGAALTAPALGDATVLVNAGGKVANFPSVADDALGNDDQKFMGWTAGSELTGTGNSAPGDLFTASTGTKPTINAPAVYHAVFATAVSSGGTTWNLCSAANEVTEGTYVITWNNEYYLPSETTGSTPAVASGITVENDQLTNTVTTAMQWTFTGDNTNGYALTHISGNNTYKLHATNSASGTSITTSSTSRKWTASVNATYGMLLHGDDGGSRNLAVFTPNSGTPSWRYYSAGNDYKGTLRLYKQTSAPAIYENYITKIVALSSIAVTTPPTKTVYKKGETLNLDGMVVTATYADASSHAVTGYTVSPTTETALATTDVKFTVSYTENEVNKTADQAIKVYALDKIEVTTAPGKTAYQEGDSFDKTGMVVTATWGTGADKIVETLAASAYTVTPSTFSSTSTTSVTISYTHQGVVKTTTQAVTVSEKPSKTMTWHVANEDPFATKIYVNAQSKYLLALPANPNPQAVGFSSDYVFKGWTTANSIKKDGTTDGTTPIVYAAADAEMENNEDFYAVFALATEDYNTIFSETFDDCNGTGGNDGSWSGSIASSDLPSSLSSWSFSKGYAAKECIKLGGSSNLGSAQTPSISLTGTATLTFKAAAWSSGSENTTLKLSVTSGTLSASSVTIKKGEWDNFSVTITSITTSTKIKFEGYTANNSRFFLDDVVVKTPVTTYSDYRLAPSAVKTPTIGLASGTYYGAQTVTLSQEDSKPIYYTLDGTTPTTASASGTSVTLNEAGTKTLKAIAYDESTEDYSQMASAEYIVVMEIADPALPASEKFYTDSKSVTITHDLTAEGAVIHYSYDDANYNIYSEALVITETKTVWAYATIGNLTSEKVSATYTKGETVVYTKVTSESDLAAGMEFVIVASTNKVAGEPYSTTSNTYLKYVEIAPSENTLSVGSQAVQVFQLDREPGAWSLGIGEGIFLIPSGGDVKVSNATSGEWSIAIDGDGKPEITCTDNNNNTKLQYNSSSPRFKTYSNQTDLDNIYAAPHTAYTLTYDVDGTDDDLVFKVVEGYEYTILNTTCGTIPTGGYVFADKWTDGTNFYKVGDKITLSADVTLTPCWKLTQTVDVDVNDMPVGVTDVIVTDGKELNVDATKTLDNLTVEAGGSLALNAGEDKQLTVNNLTINSESGKSGQVTGNNVAVNGDLVLEIKLADDLDATKYYCISAPFDVDMNGGFAWGNGTTMVFNQDFQLFEYQGDKRARTGNGWQRVSGTMHKNTAYFIVFDASNENNQNVIRLKATEKSIPTASSITFQAHDSETGDDYDANWNGSANPTLHYIGFDAIVQVFDCENQNFNPKYTSANSTEEQDVHVDYGYVVGTPFFYKGSGEISFNNTAEGAYRAPQRHVEKYTYCVRISEENATRFDNQLYVMASENAEAQYVEGHDVPTMNSTTSNYGALIWTNNYGVRLAVEEAPLVNQKASYALGIYAPAAGTYTISVAAPKENAELYLTKNGRICWNLTMGACEVELAEGQNNEYGLLLRAEAPQVTTGVETVTGDGLQVTGVQKVIIDEHVYILRGEQLYGVDGKAVK